MAETPDYPPISDSLIHSSNPSSSSSSSSDSSSSSSSFIPYVPESDDSPLFSFGRSTFISHLLSVLPADDIPSDLVSLIADYANVFHLEYTVTRKQFHNSYSVDDWKPHCEVRIMSSYNRNKTDSIIVKRKIYSISYSFRWKDQGWGNQKGMIRLVLCRDNQSILSYELSPTIADHDWRNEKNLVDPSLPIITEAQIGDEYRLEYRVGGGGGHQLFIEDFIMQFVSRPPLNASLIEERKNDDVDRVELFIDNYQSPIYYSLHRLNDIDDPREEITPLIDHSSQETYSIELEKRINKITLSGKWSRAGTQPIYLIIRLIKFNSSANPPFIDYITPNSPPNKFSLITIVIDNQHPLVQAASPGDSLHLYGKIGTGLQLSLKNIKLIAYYQLE